MKHPGFALVLALAGAALAACASGHSGEAPSALRVAGAPAVPAATTAVTADRIARSDGDARILLGAMARFTPEHFGELGMPGLDTEIYDLRPRVVERFREAVGAAAKELEAIRVRETDPYDLAILLRAAREAVRGAEGRRKS